MDVRESVYVFGGLATPSTNFFIYKTPSYIHQYKISSASFYRCKTPSYNIKYLL